MPDNEIPIKITGDSSSLKQATDDAKDQLEKAGKSVEMLGDLIGLKIPDAIKDMIASSELIGPALSEAFAPLALLTAGIELFNQLSDKIKAVTNDMAGWDASAQGMYADLVKNNQEIVKFNENLQIEKLRLNEIGKTGSGLIAQQLKDATAESDILTNKTLGGTTPVNRLRANQGTSTVVGDWSITGLGAGIGSWGTTASISSVTGNDTAGTIAITCSGTGQTVNPGFKLTFHDGAFPAIPIGIVTRGDGNGPSAPSVTFGASTTAITFGLNGVYVGGITYSFSYWVIGT